MLKRAQPELLMVDAFQYLMFIAAAKFSSLRTFENHFAASAKLYESFSQRFKQNDSRKKKKLTKILDFISLYN